MGKEARPPKLADVLFGQTRGRVLALLYGRSDTPFYFNQIRREIGATGVGAVQRELQALLQVGLVERSISGNQVFYRANRKHPAFPDLRALVAKTAGVFEALRSSLAPLSKEISLAFVYGSLARQAETAESDIDLMIVGGVKFDDLLESLAGQERSLGRAVNPTLYSTREFRSKLASGNHFLMSVVRGPKVFLIGDDDDLRKMGGVRLAEKGSDQSR